MSVDEQDELIPELLDRLATEQPDAAALITSDRKYTFAELRSWVLRIARGLASMDVGPGSTVGLLCSNRAEWIACTFAAAAVGARVAAFNTWSQRRELDHMLRHSRADVLVSLSRLRDRDMKPLLQALLPEAWEAGGPGWRSSSYPQLRDLVLIDSSDPPSGARRFEDLGAGADDADRDSGLPVPQPLADLLVLYTSGSTAEPKAVPLRHATAVAHGRDVGARMGVLAEDRIWLPVPLFWSYGGANALMVALTHGCCLVLQEVFEPSEAIDVVERHRCTVAYTLPSITTSLLSDPGFSADRMRSLVRGMTIGTPQDVRTAAVDLGIESVCNAYGSTESYGGACVTPHDWPLDRRCDSQGPALPGNEVTIRDAGSGRVLPAGEIGEITVAGQVTAGYLDQDDLNAKAFAPDGAFRTGDLGRLDSEGLLHFVARATEMIRSGGINIAPAEIEEFLLSHPDVEQAAVVGVDDERKGEVAVAFVTVRAGSNLVEADLIAHCRGNIASYKIPARVVISEEDLPRTTTGKLERRTVRERARALRPTGRVAGEVAERHISETTSD